MTFNWFSRRYDQEPEEAKPAEPEPVTEPPAEEAAAPNEDYLNWARVAYENIRKRQEVAATTDATTAHQTPTTETPTSVEPDTAAPAATPTELEPATPKPSDENLAPDGLEAESTIAEAEAQTAAPSLNPIASTVTATPQPATEPDLGAASKARPPESDLPDSLSAEEIAPEAIAPETTPLPLWMQADADRQARLEQLRSTAIVEEAEPVAATSTPAAAPNLADFVLDEGFLWSAEVLAAQGRRPDQISIEEITWLKRLRQGLDKTRRGLINQLKAIVGQGPLNQEAVWEIEAALLQADVGVEATDTIINALQKRLKDETLPPDEAIIYLKQLLRDMLDRPLNEGESPFFAPQKDVLNIWLITGVNGAGKTTTIGKLAHIAQKSGYKTLIAAADTFRAAAVEQVKVWGGRSGVEVIANPGQNTDPAAVVFDAITAAQARGTELLLVDTAGRLQNKKNLMDELSKVRRIIDKKADTAIVESLLVLDSTLGQNGLRQAQVFAESAKLSGVVLTKLDGTAKGGIALAVVQQLDLPIRFIGAGEGIEDLRPFSSYEFIEALLDG